MITAATADLLLAIGSVIGFLVKAYALKDEYTVWSRKSSGLNVVTYPFTAILPFYVLGLHYTLAMSILNFLVWLGIFVFRAPDDENIYGAEDTNEENRLHNHKKRQIKPLA